MWIKIFNLATRATYIVVFNNFISYNNFLFDQIIIKADTHMKLIK
jgi:predicted small integral membrane protein